MVLIIITVSVSVAIIVVHKVLNKPAPSYTVSPDPELTPPIATEPEKQKPIPVEPAVPSVKPPAVSVPVEPARPSVKPPTVSVPVQRPVSQPKAVTPPKRDTPAPSVPAATPERIENAGNLVFIIDDAGNNLRELEPFLNLPFPLTIAVLPGLPHSAEAAKRIRASGKEVFLHQPMESIGGQNPGPGAIYSGMTGDEIRSILRHNVAEIGPVAGINNHQGSKITADRAAVETILSFCAEQSLCFLDSRTTAETAVPAAAKNMGMKIGERDVFIDNEQDKDSMLRYVSSGLGKARQNGSVMMIGHTWSAELAPLLAEQLPLLGKQGYSIKTASAIIRGR
jgi:polysaccharide deacetylase 2 family uncharacterized protein YibQ